MDTLQQCNEIEAKKRERFKFPSKSFLSMFRRLKQKWTLSFQILSQFWVEVWWRFVGTQIKSEFWMGSLLLRSLTIHTIILHVIDWLFVCPVDKLPCQPMLNVNQTDHLRHYETFKAGIGSKVQRNVFFTRSRKKNAISPWPPTSSLTIILEETININYTAYGMSFRYDYI